MYKAKLNASQKCGRNFSVMTMYIGLQLFSDIGQNVLRQLVLHSNSDTLDGILRKLNRRELGGKKSKLKLDCAPSSCVILQ